jgi:hypothetical protein
MPSEIDSILRDYRRGKSAQYSSYNSKAHYNIQDSIEGFVSDVTPANRLTNRYNVTVPSLNHTMLRSVPRKSPDGDSQANGVGRVASPLRPGQPVIIKFLRGNSALPYIDGSLHLNGANPDFENEDIPSIDAKDDETGLTLWRTPILPATLAAGGDAETIVWPLIPRSQVPNQGYGSATCLEIPGNTSVTDYRGNCYETLIGQRISNTPNTITETDGTRLSLADLPIQQALAEVARVEASIVEELAYWRSMLNGTYSIITPHPSSTGTIGDLSFSPGSSTFLSGNLTIPTGLIIPSLPGNKEASDILDKIDRSVGMLNEASKIAGIQLNFLTDKIQKIVNLVRSVLGSFDKFGNVNLSLNIALPLNLKLSVSIKFDPKTGSISISGSLGFGSGPAPGTMLRAQALPLSSEKGLVTGSPERYRSPGYTVLEEEQTFTTVTIYTRYPSLVKENNTPYLPISFSKNIPYVLVSRDHNNLDFSIRPEEALASILTMYGVSDSMSIVTSLKNLIKTGSIFELLTIISTLSKPKEKIIISAASDLIGGGSSGASLLLEESISTVVKPALINCPLVPYDMIEVSTFIKNNEVEKAVNKLEEYFLEDFPDYYEWERNPSSIEEWIKESDNPFYPAIKELLDGKVYEFLELLIFLYTGLDIEAYPNTLAQIKTYTKTSFSLPMLEDQ